MGGQSLGSARGHADYDNDKGDLQLYIFEGNQV